MALLAIENGEVVGTASIVPHENPDDEFGPWVSGVYVPTEHRGKGIATALMKRLESEAIRLGSWRLLLRAAAPKLYIQLGYRPIGAISNGHPVMSKIIGSAPA